MQRIKQILLLYFSKQFLHFLFAGCSAAFLHWSSRILFRNIFSFITSAIFAYILALIFAFFLYRRYVFPHSDLPIQQQSIRFLIINTCFMPIVLLSFQSLTVLFESYGFALIAEPLAHAISIGFPAFITFLLYKFIAFRTQNI